MSKGDIVNFTADLDLRDQKAVPVFKNGTELMFTDISSERYREYIFPNGSVVRIDNPLQLNVSKNGHRVFDGQGVSHYIQQGWIHLKWEVKLGQPNFVK